MTHGAPRYQLTIEMTHAASDKPTVAVTIKRTIIIHNIIE